MGKKIFYMCIIALGISCKAQTIVPQYYSGMDVEGAYYKDVDNDLNNFVGTWIYTNGTTSLTITLQKKEMQYYSDSSVTFYEDVLVGGYKIHRKWRGKNKHTVTGLFKSTKDK